MLFNYHTHTFRCGHANGTDKEYVEKAIEAGVKTLGFADHAPYVFPEKGYISWHRMPLEGLQDYAWSVRALAKEYEKDIRILLGFELEYYPDFHEEEMQFLHSVKPDYLILGQHYLHNEYTSPYMRALADENLFTTYITQVIAGLATGDFLYLAHPDLPGWEVSDAVATEQYTRLCEYAKKKDIPLEINLLGLSGDRCYPNKKFFEIAGKVGNRAVFGVDAHTPLAFADKSLEEKGLRFAQETGVRLIDKPLL